MPAIDELRAFNVDASSVSLWVCRGPNGSASAEPTYTARWVRTSNDLTAVLKQTVVAEIAKVDDVQPYGLLAANLEGGAMSILADETHAGLLTTYLLDQTPQKAVRDSGDLRNIKFYVIKFIHEDRIVYAVKQTEGLWRTKNARNIRTVIFRENELTVDEEPRFELSKFIDFFIVSDEIFINQKAKFETILKYKVAHQQDFTDLRAEPEFQAIFADVAPLIAHVGSNKIQLRRASAIRQKGHYRDAEFMSRLRASGEDYGFSFAFNDENKIIATVDTCAQIMTALLDHRLTSAFSSRTYDVPNAVAVAV